MIVYLYVLPTTTKKQVCRSSLLLGRNAYGTHAALHAYNESRWCRRDRQTDGRKTVTLLFPLDLAGLMKATTVDASCVRARLLRTRTDEHRKWREKTKQVLQKVSGYCTYHMHRWLLRLTVFKSQAPAERWPPWLHNQDVGLIDRRDVTATTVIGKSADSVFFAVHDKFPVGSAWKRQDSATFRCVSRPSCGGMLWHAVFGLRGYGLRSSQFTSSESRLCTVTVV